MSILATNSTTSAANTIAATSSKANTQSLGKDDFLKLLVTQLQFGAETRKRRRTSDLQKEGKRIMRRIGLHC